jgi:hypothetical protein
MTKQTLRLNARNRPLRWFLVPISSDLDQIWQDFSAGGNCRQLGNDVEALELQAQGNDLLSQTGEVVLVGSSDLFDQAVGTQSLRQPGDLAGVLVSNASPQIFVLESTDVELAAA